ncbi:MAG: aminotransferase class IV [Cyclobacteriaceae bacterium]|nr:aminotransferase class IV [Cyclobacteriaceae bacterium SS2]
MKCIFNGQLLDQEEVSFPIDDIALLRGYGIFDFFRLSAGIPLFMEDHLDRFYKGAELARLKSPVGREELKSLLFEMFEHNKMDVSGIRIVLTGGNGNGAYAVGKSNLIITQEPISFPTDEMFANGVKLITHEYLRDLPEVKTINYMTGIWLQQQIKENGAFDVLYIHKGEVHELTRSNIFIVNQAGDLITPKERVLHGVTRKRLINAIGDVQQRNITVDELANAREVFITGTTKKVLPIHTIDEWTYQSAQEGSKTSEVMQELAQLESDYVQKMVVKK